MRKCLIGLATALVGSLCLADVIEPRIGGGVVPRDTPPGAFARPLSVSPTTVNTSGQWACEQPSLEAGVPSLIVDGTRVTFLGPRFELGETRDGVRPLKAEVWKGSLHLVPQGRRAENLILSLGRQVDSYGAELELTEGSARNAEKIKKRIGVVQFFAGFDNRLPDMLLLDEQVCVRVGFARELPERFQLTSGTFNPDGTFSESRVVELPER